MFSAKSSAVSVGEKKHLYRHLKRDKTLAHVKNGSEGQNTDTLINGFKMTAAMKTSWSAFAHHFSMLSSIAVHPGILASSSVLTS
jgi:hypothetical protein